MEQQEIIQRLQFIFESFLKDNFASPSSFYFEKLISHLAEKENIYILQAPFVIDWVDKCTSLICRDFEKFEPKVISFMLNLSSILMKNEMVLTAWQERNIMDRIFAIIEGNKARFSPSVKLGFIRLLAAISRHSLGLAYIRLKEIWNFLIELYSREHTMYVVREAQQLLYELFYKFSINAKDEKVVLDMLSEVIRPLEENVYQDEGDNIIINVDDNVLQKRLSSTLDLLTYLFEQTLSSEEKTNITNLCKIHHNLELTLWKFVEMTQNCDFLIKILCTLCSFNYAALVQDQWDKGQIEPEKFNNFGLSFFNIMKICVHRSMTAAVITLAEFNHKLWKKLGSRAPLEILIATERVKFENQLITFQLLPVLIVLRTNGDKNLLDSYITNIFEVSLEYTLPLCYDLHDLILPSDRGSINAIANLACKSIHGVLSMENILEREHAVTVFHAIMYTLKKYVLHSNDCENDWKESGTAIPNVTYACLIGLQKLIKRYGISWKESIETSSVVNMVAHILEKPNLTDRLAVQALKLLQLLVEHFYSPNMELLPNNLNGTGLMCLGSIIIKRFHDMSWEVRDSALELATSLANISKRELPAFQQILHDYKMCPIVVQMAQNDQERYVRASAFKCLSKMVLINIIWDDINTNDLIDHLFEVVFNEIEGVVRKEAVTTLALIYEHRSIPASCLKLLYSTLAYCIISDLDWEVKTEALYLWKLELVKQFANQGMTDGNCVTLNQQEIKLRIFKVFNELSQHGCLGVMLGCLRDESHIRVLQVAVSIIQFLFEKLKKYNIESLADIINENSLPTCCSKTLLPEDSADVRDTEDLSGAANSNAPLSLADHAQSDKVIESILASQDINLLEASFKSQLQLNNGNSCENSLKKSCIDANLYKAYTNVSVKDFLLSVESMDLEQLLKDFNDWFLRSESFTSLLDDITCFIKQYNDLLFADCY